MNSPGIIQGFWPAIKNIKLHAQKTMKSCSGSEGKNKVYVNCRENYKDINDYNRLKKSKSENKVAYLDFYSHY